MKRLLIISGLLSALSCQPGTISDNTVNNTQISGMKDYQRTNNPNLSKIKPSIDYKISDSIDVCNNVLPKEYEDLLENNPKIAKAMTWHNNENPGGFNFLEDCDKVKDLSDHIERRIEWLEPPEGNPDTNNDMNSFNEDDAWNIYLAHIALSLRLEIEHLTAWSLKDYDDYSLRLLFNSQNIIKYIGNGNYSFFDTEDNGRLGLTDWNPELAYNFLIENNILTDSQLETVYRFTEWCRRNLMHVNMGTPFNWDGYIGFPPVEKVLSPPEGQRHWISGCWNTASLYIAVLQAVNIPVKRNYSDFSYTYEIDTIQKHTRFELPTLGLGVAHGDDVYTKFNRPGLNQVPVENIFMTNAELEDLIDNPNIELNDGLTHTKPEQALYNSQKRIILQAYENRADVLLVERAREILYPENFNLDKYLVPIESSCANQCFWQPLFSEDERQDIRNGLDETLREIGDGDLITGCHKIFERFDKYQIP